MGKGTKIEWAHNTLNFWIGCTVVSPGCANCYAETQDGRYHWTSQGWGAGRPRKRTAPATWANLRNWHKQNVAAGRRERVFVNSLSDFFDADPAVPDAWRAEACALMAECTSFDYLLVTKRLNEHCIFWCQWLTDRGVRFALLASVEDQQRADERIPKLLTIPATWHGISAEPLLGPVDLARWCGYGLKPGNGVPYRQFVDDTSYREYFKSDPPPRSLDWVIVGGESHPKPTKARIFDRAWGKALADQCTAAGVAYFFKQEGSHVAGLGGVPTTNNDKGHDKSLWAPWMVQQFPKGMAISEGELRV
jgi:protein gp37